MLEDETRRDDIGGDRSQIRKYASGPLIQVGPLVAKSCRLVGRVQIALFCEGDLGRELLPPQAYFRSWAKRLEALLLIRLRRNDAAAQQTAASTVQLARLGSELQELTARLRV